MNVSSQPLRRALGVAAIALAIVFGITACNGGGPADALKVNGVTASTSTVNDELHAIAGVAPQYKGKGDSTIATSSASAYLTQRVEWMEASRLFEERHLTVTPADQAQAQQAADQSLGAANTAQGKKVPSWFRKFVEDNLAKELALQRTLAPAASAEQQARQYYDTHKADFTQYCYQIIPTKDEATADAATKRIQQGEDFATVAKEVTANPAALQTNDAQSCIPLSQYPPTLQGQLPKLTPRDAVKVGPTELGPGQFGFFRVYKVQTVSFDQAKAQLEQQLPPPGQAQLQALITRNLRQGSVWVNPQYGSWDKAKASVVPPSTVEKPSTSTSGATPGGATSPGSTPTPAP